MKTQKTTNSRMVKQGDIIPRVRQRDEIKKSHLKRGDVSKRFPVVLEDGKTIVYIKDKNDEARIRKQYETHMNTI